MYTNSAYLYSSDADFLDETKPLIVINCGTYQLRKKPVVITNRPNGRIDFQLLYIASGKAHFFFDEEEQIVTAGNMILYLPKEEQKYMYYGTDKTEVYWVHFTGNSVEEILKSYSIPLDEHVFYTGTPIIYESLWKQMIWELQLRNSQFEELIMMYLRQLFLFIQRHREKQTPSLNQSMMKEIEYARNYFHDHYHEAICIEDYAHARNMSTCWFIRNFRNATGSTPLQYLLSIRMSNARALLEHTEYNVTEISSLVGFDDPLYFSQQFKKHVGISPTKYRKRI